MTKIVKPKISKKVNKSFPEGAISGNMINKINHIYLSRAIEDAASEDLVNVIVPFSEGKVLEFIGQMKRAKETFKEILKKNPRNKWAAEALSEVERNLH